MFWFMIIIECLKSQRDKSKSKMYSNESRLQCPNTQQSNDLSDTQGQMPTVAEDDHPEQKSLITEINTTMTSTLL